jgi:hypothetical protein
MYITGNMFQPLNKVIFKPHTRLCVQTTIMYFKIQGLNNSHLCE